VFCALHDQLASLGRHAQLTRCFSAVAELLVLHSVGLGLDFVLGFVCVAGLIVLGLFLCECLVCFLLVVVSLFTLCTFTYLLLLL